MNTYISTNNSTQFAAVRASRAQLRDIGMGGQIVNATKKLRRSAVINTIPTLRIMENGELGYL